jgi:pilus assembly protein Flp/PilA
MIRRFLSDERGTTAIEYAVIAGLIFLAIIAAIQPIGDVLQSTFGDVNAGFEGAGA